jgi:hypothetical protein
MTTGAHPPIPPQGIPGGAAGTRTPDLRRARAALSQLSYGPAKLRPRTAALPRPAARRAPYHRATTGLRPGRVGAPGLEPGTSALSGPRSNRLSYAPVAALPDWPRWSAPPGMPHGHHPGLPHGTRGPMPKTERADPRPAHQQWPSQRVRGAAALPAIRGAPARSYHRLATGRPRGSVPTDAGSARDDLTRVRSPFPRSDDPGPGCYSLERR